MTKTGMIRKYFFFFGLMDFFLLVYIWLTVKNGENSIRIFAIRYSYLRSYHSSTVHVFENQKINSRII